jgi:hypothetical protein
MMIPFDVLKNREDRRLVPYLDAWNAAREHLKAAIALAEAREKEYQAAVAERDRKLQALNTVSDMIRELNTGEAEIGIQPESIAESPVPSADPALPPAASAAAIVRATSRKLFSLPSASVATQTSTSRPAATRNGHSLLGLR